MSTGTASTGKNDRERPPAALKSAVLDKKKPMKSEPQSPMKIVAGFVL
jgi:hypothetical protein